MDEQVGRETEILQHEMIDAGHFTGKADNGKLVAVDDLFDLIEFDVIGKPADNHPENRNPHAGEEDQLDRRGEVAVKEAVCFVLPVLQNGPSLCLRADPAMTNIHDHS